MKRLKPFVFAAAMAGVWLLASFSFGTDRYDRLGGYEPFFMERAELEHSVFYADEPREMENPGKIWIDSDGGTIYVVEHYKGVHIVDNSDAARPRQTEFIVAPGCMDIAVEGNMIYLDNAVDLVAFDMTAGIVAKRIKDYFPEPADPTGNYYYYNDSGMVLVGWSKVDNSKTGRQ